MKIFSTLIFLFRSLFKSNLPFNWKDQFVLARNPPNTIEFGDVIAEKRIHFQLRGFSIMKVREDRDDMLRIFDGYREGWVHKKDFVLHMDAMDYFTSRIEQCPSDAFAWMSRGILRTNHAGFDLAIQDFDEALRLEPNNSAAIGGRGCVLIAKKEYDSAIQDFDELIRVDGSNMAAFNDRGVAWLHKKEYEKAIQDFDEAIRLVPINSIPFRNRGDVWNRLKEYDKAIQDFDESIRLDPELALAYCVRAISLMLSRKPSIEGFKQVLTLPEAKGGLATYAAILGHVAARIEKNESEAKSFLDNAKQLIDSSPRPITTSFLVAWPRPIVTYLRGDIDETMFLKSAIENDQQTEAHCYLGLDLMLKGKTEAAIAHFRWVEEHGSSHLLEHMIAIAEMQRLEKQ